MVNVPASGIDFKNVDKVVIFKAYLVILVTTAIALLGSYLLAHGTIFWGTLTLFIFLTFFALQVILLGAADNYLRTAVILNGFAWAIFFYQAISVYFILALAFLILFLFLAARRGSDELGNSLKVKTGRVVRAVVGLSLTAAVIFIFVSMILAGKITLTEEGMRDLTDIVLTPIAKHYVKDFTPDMETGVFFTKLAERNLITNRQFVNQSVNQLKKDVEGYLGAEIDLKQSVSKNLYQAFQFKISSLTPQAKLYWALIILAIIFLSVKSVEFLIALPLTLLVFLLYQAALVFNFASVDLKDRSQEVVLLNR